MVKGKKKASPKDGKKATRMPPNKTGSTGRKHIPWEKAEVRYVTAEWPDVVTYETLAKEYGVSLTTVKKEGRKRKWPDKRDKWLKAGTQELLDLASKHLGRMKLKDLEKVNDLLEMVEKLVDENPRAWKGKDILALMKYKLVLLGEPDVTIGGSIEFNDARERLLELIGRGRVKRTDIRAIPGKSK